MRRSELFVLAIVLLVAARRAAAGDLDQARHAVQARDVRGGGQECASGWCSATASSTSQRRQRASCVQKAGVRGDARCPRDMRDADRRPTTRVVAAASTRSRTTSSDRRSTARRSPSTSTKVAIKAPIKYPVQPPGGRGELQAARRRDVRAGQPAAEGGATKPIRTRKIRCSSPSRRARASSIPTRAIAMPPGRNIDWEGELAIIIGKPAFNVTEAQAHDYVFGYSIMYDLSDRGGTGRRPLTGMFNGPNWFARQERRSGRAPFGPFIVPKEFVANPPSLPHRHQGERRGEAGRRHQELDLGRGAHGALPHVDPHALSRRRDLERHAGRRRRRTQAAGIPQARRRRRRSRSTASARCGRRCAPKRRRRRHERCRGRRFTAEHAELAEQLDSLCDLGDLAVAFRRHLGAAAGAAPPDTILVNGHVVTVDARFSIAEAVAIAGGRFTAVGTQRRDPASWPGRATTTIDLHGQTVIPGLADGHLHDAGGGPASISLARQDARRRCWRPIAARVQAARSPATSSSRNSDWHEAQLKEHRLPYRARSRHRVAGQPGGRSCAAATSTS